MPDSRPESGAEAASLRLDKFLWFARIVKTRSLARDLAEKGHLRMAGRVVNQAHAPVRIGDVLSFAVRGTVRVIRVERLPRRRGPPEEARRLYSDVEVRHPPDAAALSPDMPTSHIRRAVDE